jgi:hypothetical protein
MFNTIVGAGAVGAGAASCYGSGSDQKMQLLAAPAPQHCCYPLMNTDSGALRMRIQYDSGFETLVVPHATCQQSYFHDVRSDRSLHCSPVSKLMFGLLQIAPPILRKT